MKKISLLLVIILTFTFTAYLAGQEVKQTDSTSFAGKKAFTFAFDGLYLSSGLGLGGTFWLNNDWALRVLLSGYFQNDLELDDNYYNHYSRSINITAYLKRHFHPSQRLSPYVGTGIGIGYSVDIYSFYSEPSKSGTVKVPIIAGAEYWVTDNISLSGEQMIGFSFLVSQVERRYTVSSSTSSLLLSVYF